MSDCKPAQPSVEYPRLLPVGEAAFTIEFGDCLDEALNRRVYALDAALAARSFAGLVETVPTYRSLLVLYDPLVADAVGVRRALEQALRDLREISFDEGRLVEIPVCYGGEWGPDLQDVAAHCGLTVDAVIRLHTEPTYRVAMMGFAPGFTYLAGMSPRLSTPRLPTPRLRVEAGSVGIAGPQTGVYALPTPGGWRIIGRTPLALFDATRKQPFALRAGDRVRFVALDDYPPTSATGQPQSAHQHLRAEERRMLKVVDGGFLTTVQAAGRVGWARYGVPPSGPLDWPALQMANSLVGNAAGAAGLEVTLTGPVLRASHACLMAVCGAEFELWVDDLPVPMWHAILVRPGHELRFGQRRSGARAYLAVSGGIALEPALGSCATCLPGNFGGLQGRALRRGDCLPLGEPDGDRLARAGRAWPRQMRPCYQSNPTVRVVMGPQDDHFTPEAIQIFLSSAYRILAASDRMGYRLEGLRLAHCGRAEIVSDGVVTGSIQVPADGQPIVMMADHQTTGGYPKIATVIRADVPLLAQCLPGDHVRFQAVSVAEAQAAWREQQAAIAATGLTA